MDPAHTANKPRIVVIGGGFGGAYCAQAMENNRLYQRADILLIDRNNYFIFYPLLVEAGTGSLEPRHALVSIRSFLHKIRFLMAEVTGVDFDRRIVFAQVPREPDPRQIPYDHLVLSPGSVTNLPPVPGLADRGFGMKSLPDALALRDHAIQMLEIADAALDPDRRKALLHLVVVGGNYTGVEVAGEFQVFLENASRYYRNVSPDDCRVTLIELTDRILAALDPDLSQYALAQLAKRNIDVLLNTTISHIHDGYVDLRDGRRLPTHTVVWCAGIAPPPLLRRLHLPTDQRGYILCDRELRVQGCDNVWAIGDAAVNLDAHGNAYPATAQHAVRQGDHLAHNLARALHGDHPTPCDITNRGAIAPLGCRTAVAKILGFKLAGFPAWFTWRTFYLLKMPGITRKVRIALDWTVDLLFRRDYVQMGLTHEKKK